MLQEQDRQKLDGIVQQMIQNNEPDNNIQAVVNDFKSKYDKPADTGGTFGAINRGVQGFSHFVGEDIFGAESLGRSVGTLLRTPGEAIVNRMTAGIDTPVNQSMAQLAQVNNELIRKVRTLPDGDPRKQQLNSVINENMGILQNRQPSTELTQGQVFGRAIEAGARVAPFVTGLPASYLGGAGVFGGIAGGTAFGQSLAEGKPIGEATKGAIIPTLFGVGAGLLTRFLGNKLTQVTRDAPERLYQSALKQSTPDLKKELVEQAPNLSKQLIEQGVSGNSNKILTQSLVGINESEKSINNIIAKEAKKTINTKSIISELSNLSKRYANALGPEGTTAIDAVKDNIVSKGKTISFEDALQLKRDIYSVLSNNAFNVDAALSQKAEALRIAAHSIMEQMAKQSPALAKINGEQQMWIRTSQAMEGVLSRAQKTNLLGLNDVILAAGGLTDPSTIMVGVGRKLIESTAGKTNLAVGLDRLGKAIESMPETGTGKITKAAVLNLINKLTGGF